jgi:hypothetical protein
VQLAVGNKPISSNKFIPFSSILQKENSTNLVHDLKKKDSNVFDAFAAQELKYSEI